MLNLVKLTEYTNEMTRCINVGHTYCLYGHQKSFNFSKTHIGNIEYFHIIATYSTQLYVCTVLL